MKIASRLVGEQQLWMQDNRTSDTHKLLLTSGKLVGEQILFSDDMKPVQSIAHQAHAFLMRNILVRERHLQIFKHRQIVDQVIALENKADVRLVKFITLLGV